MHDRTAILLKNKRKTHRNIEISSLPFWQRGPPQKCKWLIVRSPPKIKKNSPCDVLRPSKASISHLQRSRSPVDKNVHTEHCQAGSTQAPEFPANDRGKPTKDLECHEVCSATNHLQSGCQMFIQTGAVWSIGLWPSFLDLGSWINPARQVGS